MDASLKQLYLQGIITREEARRRMKSPDQLTMSGVVPRRERSGRPEARDGRVRLSRVIGTTQNRASPDCGRTAKGMESRCASCSGSSASPALLPPVARGALRRSAAAARSAGADALLAGLLLALGYRTEALAREDLLPIIAACIWWLPFVVWLAFQGSGRRLTPRLVDRAKVSSSFRGAVAAAKRKDYHEALLLYHQAAVEYPQDPDPPRCMAELFLQAGLPDDAIVSFLDAQKLVREPDDQLLLAFAIAEALAEDKKDVPAAIQVLEGFSDEIS